MQMIGERAYISGELVPARQDGSKGMETDTFTMQILTPVYRLLAPTEDPDAIPFLAPLIKKEIHYRLMKSSQPQRLKEIASVQSHVYRIAKATVWLKLNYHRPMKNDELATKTRMSWPTFHLLFGALSDIHEPVEFQKRLRLTEAKRLMLSDKLDAATASWRVGYENPSQFSREYLRLFGPSLSGKDTRGHEGPEGV